MIIELIVRYNQGMKLIIHLSTWLLFICSSPLIAQNLPSIQWEKSFGGSDIDKAMSIEQTRDSGFIAAASSRSTDGDVYSNHGGSDYWILKLDADGNVIWQTSLGGSNDEEPACIHQTADSGYVVAGFTFSSDGDVTENHGNEDYWIVKLNKNGVLQWQKSYGGLNEDEANSVIETSDGKFIVAGTTRSNNGDVTYNHGGNDLWILKLDAIGNLIWQKTFGGSSYDVAHSVVETFDHRYVVAGWAKSNDGDVLENHGNDDLWILNLDTGGNLIWQRSYGGLYNEEGHYIEQLPGGGFIAGGYTSSNDSDVSGNHGSYDYWITRLDSNADLLWQKCFGGSSTERSYSFLVTDDGNIILSGYSESADGDVTTNYGSQDYWIVEIDSTGNILWQTSLGGSGIDIPRSINSTADGGLIVAGGSDSNDHDVNGNHGLQDVWIVKLKNDVSVDAQTLSHDSISFFPNPVTDHLTISFESNLNLTDETIRIFDLQGRQQILRSIYSEDPHHIRLNTESLTDGFYILEIINSSEHLQEKFLKSE